MSKCFRFLGCLGLASICNVSYGVYPSAKDMLRQLRGESGLDSTFKRAFGTVLKEALQGGFENFPILGEKQGLITAFDKDLDPFETSVLQRTDSIWGEFSWKLNGTNISKADQIRAAIEKEHLSLSKKGFKNLTKVCQTLLSERFAENLLGKKAVYALYGYCKEKPYSSFSVNFDRYTYDGKPGVFWFRILYSQQHQSGQVFMIGFHFWYDVKQDPKKDCFVKSVRDRVRKNDVPCSVEVSCFWINDYQIRSHTFGLTNKQLLSALKNPTESGVIDFYHEAAEDEKDTTEPVAKEDEKDTTEPVVKEEPVAKLSQGTEKPQHDNPKIGKKKHRKKRRKK